LVEGRSFPLKAMCSIFGPQWRLAIVRLFDCSKISYIVQQMTTMKKKSSGSNLSLVFFFLSLSFWLFDFFLFPISDLWWYSWTIPRFDWIVQGIVWLSCVWMCVFVNPCVLFCFIDSAPCIDDRLEVMFQRRTICLWEILLIEEHTVSRLFCYF
jgi:hypothetical protein